MRLLIVFLTFFSILGCTKKPIDQTKPEQPSKDSAYVWRQLVYPENTDLKIIERGGFGPFVNEGKLITTLLPLANKNMETLGLFDVNKRIFLWKWNDYFSDARQDLIGGVNFPNTKYVFSGKEHYYLSLETGETLLKYRLNTNESIEGGCVAFGDNIFHVRRKGSSATPYEMTLYMSTKMSEKWMPIFKLEKDDEGYCSLME